jgi:hypothetical protein
MFEGLFLTSAEVVQVVPFLCLACVVALSRRCQRLERRVVQAEQAESLLQDRIEEVELRMPSEQVMSLLYRLDAGAGSGVGPYNTPTGSPFWRREAVEVWVTDPNAIEFKELV